MTRRILRLLRGAAIALVVLLLALVGLSALSNLSLPTTLVSTGRLSDLQKARVAEARHLQQTLGDAIWPGWSQLDTPYIVHDAEYAYLVGYPNPPPGWMKMPQRQAHGGAWEPVADDTFEGQVYYRQKLTDPNITPENFTVLVGDRWAATLQVKEYMEVAFYAGFREELPPPLRPVFPYRLIWRLLMRDTDSYIAALLHEGFHAFQGTLAPERLAAAENVTRFEPRYPWDDADLAEGWQQEVDFLARAVRASSTTEAADLAGQFLSARAARRAATGLAADLVDYERQREWLEGLAKYAEVSVGRAAVHTAGYSPLPEVTADPAFQSYANSETYYTGQLSELPRTSGRSGDTRFYYSGMAQAVLLDRLLPGWQARAFDPTVTLEYLLQDAISRNATP
jgi:hypothetical protein